MESTPSRREMPPLAVMMNPVIMDEAAFTKPAFNFFN
jgi:hypothetical protein